ncbi:MAG: MMPL family transporter [Micrococcales bacterium]
MAKLLQRLGAFSAKRAWAVVITWLLILVGSGTWAALGMGKLSTSMSIDGVPAQTVIDQLQKSFPEAARGSGSVVFHTTNGKPFTYDQKSAIADILEHVKTMEAVADTIDPFKLAVTKADAEAKIADGKVKIAEAKATIAANEKKLKDGKAQLVSAKSQLDSAKHQLSVAKAQIDAGRAQYQQAKDNLAAAQAGVQYLLLTQGESSPAYQTALATLNQMTAGIAQFEAGLTQYNAGKAQYQAGLSKYYSGISALADGEKKLAEGKKTLADKETELLIGDRLFQASKGFGLLSKDETTAVAQIQFTKPGTELETYQKMNVVDYVTAHPISGVQAEFTKELTQSIGGLLGIGEIIGLIIAAVVLFLMLGTLIGAGLPLVSAVVGVGISASITLALSGVIDMSSTTPVLGVMLGLAVGIDYALFLFNRHRKQLKNGMELRASIALSNGTSGNAVVFAGLTVIIALLALNLTGVGFLGLMGTMASMSILVAIILAVTLTPALMALIGMKALSKKERSLIGKETKKEIKAREAGMAKPALVVRHPWITMVTGVVALAIVAIPFFSMRLGLPDGSAEPTSSTQYKSYQLISKAFGPGANGQVLTIVTLPKKLEDTNAENTFKAEISERLDTLKNVDTALPGSISADGTKYLFVLIPKTGPSEIETTNLVYDIRDLASEMKNKYDAEIGVTGVAAMNIDISQRMSSVLPLYLTVVILLSILLMILVFRSIAVPIVASAGFLLSVSAALGSVVAIFQWGWLGFLTDVHDPGPIMNFLPSISIGILFGLAMDYQLFLATGMREAYVHGKSPRDAVNHGLKLSRSVVLAAASIMVSVFGSFMFSESTMIRPIGFALGAGVLFDAFIVRLLLMPAALTVLGKGAWWIPKWLDRMLPDVDVEGAKLERHGH